MDAQRPISVELHVRIDVRNELLLLFPDLDLQFGLTMLCGQAVDDDAPPFLVREALRHLQHQVPFERLGLGPRRIGLLQRRFALDGDRFVLRLRLRDEGLHHFVVDRRRIRRLAGERERVAGFLGVERRFELALAGHQ